MFQYFLTEKKRERERDLAYESKLDIYTKLDTKLDTKQHTQNDACADGDDGPCWGDILMSVSPLWCCALFVYIYIFPQNHKVNACL
jgi:hypothetical protein